MKHLERLALNGANVSNEPMGKLRAHKNLKTIHIGLSDDQVEQKKKLQELLPEVSIN